MASTPNIDWSKTAVLIMDYQNDIIGMQPVAKQNQLIDKASSILARSRGKGVPVVYVVVRFRDGYPEINPDNRAFRQLKESGRLVEGTQGAEIHLGVSPQAGEIVVTKRRVGAFSSTELATILRAKNISTLVLLGISTSGVVLSTVRWAADLDYSLFVVSDACADADEEVHRVLVDKVFPRQSSVVATRELLDLMGS